MMNDEQKRMSGFLIHHSSFIIHRWLAVLVEQRSARHPDMVEAGGSNPPEGTWRNDE